MTSSLREGSAVNDEKVKKGVGVMGVVLSYLCFRSRFTRRCFLVCRIIGARFTD